MDARVGALIAFVKTLAPWSGPTRLGWMPERETGLVFAKPFFFVARLESCVRFVQLRPISVRPNCITDRPFV